MLIGGLHQIQVGLGLRIGLALGLQNRHLVAGLQMLGRFSIGHRLGSREATVSPGL